MAAFLIRSGRASLAATALIFLICGGSAVTWSVWTVIASTVPSLVVIWPRGVGTVVVAIRCRSLSVFSFGASTPCSWISRPTIIEIAKATDSKAKFSRRVGLVRRSFLNRSLRPPARPDPVAGLPARWPDADCPVRGAGAGRLPEAGRRNELAERGVSGGRPPELAERGVSGGRPP